MNQIELYSYKDNKRFKGSKADQFIAVNMTLNIFRFKVSVASGLSSIRMI